MVQSAGLVGLVRTFVGYESDTYSPPMRLARIGVTIVMVMVTEEERYRTVMG
jgi:hypothetical protein